MHRHSNESRKPSLIRGLCFHISIVFTVIIWAFVSIPSFPLPFRWRYWWITRWCYVVSLLVRFIGGIRVDIEGLENRPATPGVILSKHQSAWETLNLLDIFYPQTWVLKQELLKIPVFGWGLGRLEPIAINRRSTRDALRDVVNQGQDKLKKGRWVMVFPEGTRVAVGDRGRYQQGGALLACRAGVAVTPLAHNAGEYWPRRGLKMRPGTIRVRIGPAIATQDKTPAEVMAETESWIEAAMVELTTAP
ncbi:MAG: lysophospholipid acyltransferase family protein [Spiribacter sp.]|jgi:1-acyl-sn-glycerol-3-phosphate acyltransferase|nr:lysophospholipid acyltransferase family protein [Spiribacter sp.]MDR9489350.1 lysophospholipid acyltransferase family protein [Spiribacter sp.]